MTSNSALDKELTAEDYARAERFLPWNAPRHVLNGDIQHHWIGREDRFWYRRSAQGGEKQFVMVDAVSGSRSLAFDHSQVARALSTATGVQVDAADLPFTTFRFVESETAIEFRLGERPKGMAKDRERERVGQWYRCDLKDYVCTPILSGAEPNESRAPDGKWAAFVKDHNLWIRPMTGGMAFALTADGSLHHGYGAFPGFSTHFVSDLRHPKPIPPQVLWSEDSRFLLVHRLNERHVKDLHLLQSVPEDGSFRPKLYSYRYPMPGDEAVPLQELIIFDVARRQRIDLAHPPLHCCCTTTLIESRYVWWSGGSLYFLDRDRFCRTIALKRASPETGEVTEILRESSPTVVQVAAGMVYEYPAVRVLSNGSILWYSERSGWGHLYYYDAEGVLLHPITAGEWVVRSVVHVDETARRIYFLASGPERGRDPYEQRLYSVGLDGSDLRLLTPEEAEHEPYHPSSVRSAMCAHLLTGRSSPEEEVAELGAFSPSGRFFLDTYSRPDTPPVTVLRTCDGDLVKRLEAADISKLEAGGHTPIEPFEVLAADGRTPIYGNLLRPSRFDPGRRYPVIDANYPGPHITRTERSFMAAVFDREGAQAIAELGFIVVTIDGRGTPNRSKAFLDHSYGRLDRASDLSDHIAAICELAKRYPYMDTERVGIYGNSGGGFRAAHAILAHPEVFKVAVASEGNHDQSLYLSPWAETYIGPLAGNDYEAASTPRLAGNLKGKLLLMHGEMDDNVHPAMTLRLAESLIRANKDFDLLIMPNENHLTAFHSPYFIRRQWDYFVRHLMGVEPPAEYRIQPAPPTSPEG